MARIRQSWRDLEAPPVRRLPAVIPREGVMQRCDSLSLGGLFGDLPQTGSLTVARKPPSGLSDSMISPPCERAISREMARPRPEPP